MQAKVEVIALAVADVEKSKAFYGEGLGLKSEMDHGFFVQYDLGPGSSKLALYERNALAGDAGVKAPEAGSGAFMLSCGAGSSAEVDALLAQARKAGGRITKPGAKAQWGGYFGYVADPDGHLWKVATNNG